MQCQQTQVTIIKAKPAIIISHKIVQMVTDDANKNHMMKMMVMDMIDDIGKDNDIRVDYEIHIGQMKN